MPENDAADQHSLATALVGEGKLVDAEKVLNEILRAHPNDAQAHHNLGTVLAQQGKFEPALTCFLQAIQLDPGYISARKNMARALTGLGRHPEATTHLRQAARLAPNDADILGDLGSALNLSGAPEQAIAVLRQACRVRPDSPDLLNSLGLAQLAAGKLDAAEITFDTVLKISPGFGLAHVNLGTTLKESGRVPEAIACYDHALRLDPENPSTHWNRALALLQSGQFEAGWQEYEWRWRRPASPPRPFTEPLWDGSDLTGKTLLFHPEQGLGDTIQFIRYAALAKRCGAARVIFECQSPLAGVLANVAGVDQIVVEGNPLPPFDVHLPLMGAPQRFKTTLQNVPAPIPYITVPSPVIEHWKARLGHDGTFRVGIAWQGNPHHQLDRFRSLPLSLLEPLSRIPECTFVSLQRGPGAEQLDDRFNQRMGIREITQRAVSTTDDWLNTAAIMRNLDLVITVDTATAHLAGALGVPVWTLLSASPDWRWLLKRQDTPWYPTMRLFRQERLGEWEPVVARMAADLEKSARSRIRVMPSLATQIVNASTPDIAPPSLRRHQKLAVATLVTGAEFEALAKITQPSQLAYAERLGADFVVLNKRVAQHPHYDKWQIHDLLDIYDRLIFIDADAIVRPDCPDLFLMVPPECVGGENELLTFPDQAQHLANFANRLGVAPPPCTFYINTGVMVVSACHRELFRIPEVQPTDLPWPEQTHFNLRLLTERVPVCLLPEAFNDRHRRGDYLRQSYILHYSCMLTDRRTTSATGDLSRWNPNRNR